MPHPGPSANPVPSRDDDRKIVAKIGTCFGRLCGRGPGAAQNPSPVRNAPRQEGLIVALLLLFAVAFNLYHLWPEVAIQVPPLNDGVLHLVASQGSVAALAAGQDPTDPWLAGIALGYPLAHHYQHLPHVFVAALYHLLRGTVPLFDLLNWTRYLLLSLFPLSIYGSMRRFGFSPLAAAMGGLAAPLLSTDGLYGFDLGSYIWRGYGMYTQLWGMFLLPLALAQGQATLKSGRGYLASVLLLAATAMSHLVLGYVAITSIACLAFLPTLGRRAVEAAGPSSWQRGARLLLLLLLVAGVTAYFWVPYLLDGPYMNRSVWEEQGKYDAYGYEWTLGALVKGELFDFDRFPSLTLLAAAGLAFCLWRWREERYRIPVVLSALWLLLYFGRPTWGVLLDLLPMGRDLHLHRLIAGFHLGGTYLMGLGLALPWRWALHASRSTLHASRRVSYPLAAAALTVLLLYPVYEERGAYLGGNARLMAESRDALAAEEEEIAALLATLQRAPPGRVYAGRGGNWGKDYKVGAIPVYALLNGAGLDTLGYLYHALSLSADVQVLFDESRPEQYDLFNVRYVVAPVERAFPDFVRPVGEYGRHCLYQVETTGYLDLVGSDAAFQGDKSDFYPAAAHWLASDLPRVKQHPALLFDEGTGGEQRTFSLSQAQEVIPMASFPLEPPRGRVLSETVEDNAYSAQVEVTRESALMLKATYHPNWHAIMDGVEAGTVMLMPSYVGTKVSAGVHHVRFEYRPRPLRRTLQIAGLLALPLIALAEWRWKELARRVRLWPVRQRVKSGLAAWVQRTDRKGTAPHVSRLTFHVSRLTPHVSRLTPHLPYLGRVFLMALLAGLPLFQFKVMSGHDALEYLPRAVEFYQGLKAGQAFPRWAPDLSAGYGQPFFIFNPPLFYYLSALFHALGSSFVAAQNLACFALLLLAGLGMYALGSEVYGPRGGLVSAVAYLYAPYLLATLYVRHALADFAAFPFIPLTLWALYRYAKGGRTRFLLIGALSLALLLLSSNPVALITFLALALLLGWQTWAGRSWRTLLRGTWCLALGLGLSAFFWLPALVERSFVHLSRLLEGYLNYRNHFLSLYQLIHSPWGYGLSLPGPGDGMSLAIGPVHLLLTGVALWAAWRSRAGRDHRTLLVSFSLLLLLVAAFLASYGSAFLWDRLPLLQYIEFPWRTLSLVAASTAFLCGAPFLLVRPGKGRLANSLTGVLIAALFLSGFRHAKPEKTLEVEDADYSLQAIASGDISVTTAREYEPIWVRKRPQAPATEPLTLMEGEGRVLSARLSPTYYEFQAQIAKQARLRINTFYFPGWTLYVDGEERAVDYGDPQGVMTFSLEAGEHLGQIVFADTPVRSWSKRLSLLALFLLLSAPWLKAIHHSTQKPGL